MKKFWIALLAAVLCLSVLSVSPVKAMTGSIVLNQPQPIYHGNIVTFTTTHDAAQKNGSFYIWLECEQTLDGVLWSVYNERKPEGSSFLLDSPYWDVNQTATCFPALVYEVTYGGGKIKRQYLEGSTFLVIP